GAEATLRKTKADLVKETANYNAQKTLYEKEVASKAAYDQALATYTSAQETVKEAETKLNLARRDLANTALRSPIDGVISKRHVDPAVVVSTGRVVFDLQGAGDLQVSANVPDTMVKAMKKGAAAVVTFPTVRDLKLAGKIDEIGGTGEEANTFPITVRLIAPTADIRVGMAAEVHFTFTIPGFKTAFALPVSAFVPRAKGTDRTGFVYVFDPASKTVKRREVFVVAIRGNDVLIGKGLKDGDRVAVAGVSFLHDGMTVKLLARN
ncbi:MAG: efflux RND transporter periplasmic adaptor subunit, partial [Bauldia litoralis]